jgi:hypothetical protein
VFESKAGDEENSSEGFEEARFDGEPAGEAFSEGFRERVVGAGVWAEIRIPVVQPDGWPVHHLRMGLRELERLHREVDAARALLTGAMPESRDTIADIARITGVSNREARRRKSVADVCSKVKGAFEKLRSGAISNEHVSALAPVADLPGAASLLDDAESKSPEELTRDVEEFRLSSGCGDDMGKRQRARRSIRFFAGPEGMIGINGLLPPVEGSELRTRLAAIVDAKWRSEHPDRAKVLGGHGGDNHDQRMADALLAITGVNSWNSDESQATGEAAGAEGGRGSQGTDRVDTSSGAIDSSALQDSRRTNDSAAPEDPRRTRGSNTTDDCHRESNDSGESHENPGSDGASESAVGDTSLSNRSSQPSAHSEGTPIANSASEVQWGSGRQVPTQALSLRAGLRLFGLTGSEGVKWQGKVPNPNSPPATAATTVKTGKPAVVIVFDVDRWQARIAGGGPIPITESLLDQARNDLYYCFNNMVGEVIKFGRSRREPTPLQKLVLVVRDEKCLYPGCHAPPDACDAHHLNEVVKDKGRTDTDVMGLFCEAHHRHIHLNDLVVKRNSDRSLTIRERQTGVVVASSSNKRAA